MHELLFVCELDVKFVWGAERTDDVVNSEFLKTRKF